MEAELCALARLFEGSAKLYAVGGYVRDKLLGIPSGDIDICAPLEPSEVKKLLTGSDFHAIDKSLRMGTLIIKGRERTYEYTAFRTDSYDRKSGAHYPVDVRFTTSIEEDARRRDFTCNAVYLDILSGDIVDPLGGVKDIRARILRTADVPSNTFEADGLRILRLARFYVRLGFEAEEETLKAAIRNAYRIKSIAAERIKAEMDEVLRADVNNKSAMAHPVCRGVEMLNELGIIKLLSGAHMGDDEAHTAGMLVEHMSLPYRWAGYIRYTGADVEITRKLRFSTAEKDRTKGFIEAANEYKNAENLRLYAVRYAEYAEEIARVLDFERETGVSDEGGEALYEAIKETRSLPKRISELKVGGEDLIVLGVPERMRTRILSELLVATALDALLDDRERALEWLSKMLK